MTFADSIELKTPKYSKSNSGNFVLKQQFQHRTFDNRQVPVSTKMENFPQALLRNSIGLPGIKAVMKKQGPLSPTLSYKQPEDAQKAVGSPDYKQQILNESINQRKSNLPYTKLQFMDIIEEQNQQMSLDNPLLESTQIKYTPYEIRRS